MKPWERDIQELERYFAKTQEAENMKLNSAATAQSAYQQDPTKQGLASSQFSQDPAQLQQSTISSTLALIQYHKERNKKEALA